jgi:L-alanine-DL-glutamate epimerase-like enolase superfamily enzyme
LSSVQLDVVRAVSRLPRPFSHARASRVDTELVVVRLEIDGVVGVGECVPREYVTGETIDSVFAAYQALPLGPLAEVVGGATPAAALECVGRIERQVARGGELAYLCALDLALVDLIAKRFAISIAALLGPSVPAAVRHAGGPPPVVRAISFDDEPEVVAGFPPGAVIKVKVGRDLAGDAARVAEIRRRLGPGPTLVVDANMAWTLEEAIAAVGRLAASDIAWFEEPLARGALAAYRQLRAATGARVMLDESLCSFDHGRAALEAEACDLFNLRLSKCGGFLSTIALAELGVRHGLGLQLGAQIGQNVILWAAGRRLVELVGPISAWEGADLARMTANPFATPADGPGLGVELARDRLIAESRAHLERRLG